MSHVLAASAARLLLLGAGILAVARPAPLTAQVPAGPHVGYVYPAGLRRGGACEVVVGGRSLQGTTGVLFSGQGISAEVIATHRPLTNEERMALQTKLRQLQRAQRQRRLEPAEEKELAGLRQRLFNPRQQQNPQLAETVVLRLTAAQDAPPGRRDLRLLTPGGASNPLRFEVGAWPEHIESEPNDQKPDADLPGELPVVLNGQIMPGDVDRFRIRVRKGCHLVIAASARELIPYLADAVPGWFQATLALYDGSGNELAFADDHLFHPDPVISFAAPADGDYVLEIRDAIWRGREDFVYRITVGELALVTSVFPLGARVRQPAALAVRGFNLPAERVELPGLDGETGIRTLSVGLGAGTSDRVPFAVDRLPECLEQEPNDDAATAQKLVLPVIVNGRIDRPGARDVFRIEGHAGQRLVAEVEARRLGSPLDSALRLTDDKGRSIEVNDDHEDQGAGLVTHQADSLLSVRLPASGTYYLQLLDIQGHAGPDHAYRLRVGAPRPGFALQVVPSSINVRAGATVPFTVHALRQDGFAGDIQLVLENAPPGFELSGGRIPGRADAVRLTLTAPAGAPAGVVHLAIEGRALIAGKEVRNRAVAADDMMQAFAYRHLVPAEDLVVAVVGRGNAGASPRLHGVTPVRLPAGGTVEVELRGGRRPLPESIQFVLDSPPDGVSIAAVKPGKGTGGLILVLRADAKTTAGLEGNLIVGAFAERAAPARGGAQRQRPQRAFLGALPAIPFEIVRKP